MGTTAQIEKTIMSAHAALDGEIGGYRRIKTARNQGQHAFLRAQRIAAQPLAPAGQHVQGIGLNFQPDGDVRPVQIDARRLALVQQPPAYVTLHVGGAELVLATALDPHAEGFARQGIGPVLMGFGQNVIHIAQGIGLYTGKIGDTRGAWQYIRHLIRQSLIGTGGLHLDFLPIPPDAEFGPKRSKQEAQNVPQLLDESFAHRGALHNNVVKYFDDKMHENLLLRVRNGNSGRIIEESTASQQKPARRARTRTTIPGLKTHQNIARSAPDAPTWC